MSVVYQLGIKTEVPFDRLDSQSPIRSASTQSNHSKSNSYSSLLNSGLEHMREDDEHSQVRRSELHSRWSDEKERRTRTSSFTMKKKSSKQTIPMSAPSSSTGFAAAQSASPSPSKRFFSFLMSSNSSAKSSTSRSRSYSVSSTRAPLAAIEPNLARTTLPHFQTGDGRIVNSKAGKLLAIVIPSNKSRVIVEVDEVEEEDDPYSTEDRPSINNSSLGLIEQPHHHSLSSLASARSISFHRPTRSADLLTHAPSNSIPFPIHRRVLDLTPSPTPTPSPTQKGSFKVDPKLRIDTSFLSLRSPSSPRPSPIVLDSAWSFLPTFDDGEDLLEDSKTLRRSLSTRGRLGRIASQRRRALNKLEGGESPVTEIGEETEIGSTAEEEEEEKENEREDNENPKRRGRGTEDKYDSFLDYYSEDEADGDEEIIAGDENDSPIESSPPVIIKRRPKKQRNSFPSSITSIDHNSLLSNHWRSTSKRSSVTSGTDFLHFSPISPCFEEHEFSSNSEINFSSTESSRRGSRTRESMVDDMDLDELKKMIDEIENLEGFELFPPIPTITAPPVHRHRKQNSSINRKAGIWCMEKEVEESIVAK